MYLFHWISSQQNNSNDDFARDSPILLRTKSTFLLISVASCSTCLLLNANGSRPSTTSRTTSAFSSTDLRFGKSRLIRTGTSSSSSSSSSISAAGRGRGFSSVVRNFALRLAMLSAPTLRSFGLCSSEGSSSFSTLSSSSDSQGSPRARALALARARCLSAFFFSFSSAA